MRQIYYTQCPIGYGLGATSGFQIKRLDPGYPTTGDFRHLALRAFLPGTRELAPPALRYRRVGDVAEVAWLTPRQHEYETEGGRLWGRPGGQFAHGLRLEPDEMAALRQWPAGLHDRPFWVRSDPERTMGRPPADLTLDAGDLLAPPTFDAVAPLAGTIDHETLARLLAALARATRDGRTLVVAAEPERLWQLAALLTFAFPEPLRTELTFSTYHDRPEELSGFRLQGTLPSPRANRAILAGLGTLADLSSGSFEPGVSPAPWARTLAGWLLAADDSGQGGWERTARRLRQLRAPEAADERWSDDWLDHLFGFDAATNPPFPVPNDRAGWIGFLGLIKWSARHGLDAEWAGSHDPSWWRAAHPQTPPLVEARVALVAQGRLSAMWRPDTSAPASMAERAAHWGELAALWFAGSEPAERTEAAARLLRSAPAEARGAFLASLVRSLGDAAGGDLIERLARDPAFDRGLLLPVEAAQQVGALVAGRAAPGLARTIEDALARPDSTASTLSASAEDADGRVEIVERLANLLADGLERDDLPGWKAAWRWGLERSDREHWLRPYLRRLFAHPDRQDTWEALRERTPEPLRAALAGCFLNVAREPDVPAGTYLWGVERLLLPIEPAARPVDPRWADDVLSRLSGLELARRLYLRATRDRPLSSWLAEAGRNGMIGPRQAGRVRAARDFATALEAGDTTLLGTVALPDVPPGERGALLEVMLHHVSGTTFEGVLRCLDVARRDWTNSAFLPGAEGLDEIAVALARPLARYVDHPERWCDALVATLDRLALRGSPAQGFEPDGLAAHLVAVADRAEDAPGDVWPLRNALFARPDTWRCLALAVQRDLPDRDPQALNVGLERWNDGLLRGSMEAESRFHELVMNAAVRSGPWAYRKLVIERAREVVTLDRALPWWDHVAEAEARDDLRDAFARRTPLAPLPSSAFLAVRRWLRQSSAEFEPGLDLDLDLAPEDRLRGADRQAAQPGDFPHLSALGWARWSCIEALTVASRPGLAPSARWQSLETWRDIDLPLGDLDLDDRYRVLAEVIRLLDDYEPDEIAHERRLSSFARWLVEAGVRDVARIQDWGRDLATLATNELLRSRRPLVGALATLIREELESRSRRRG